MKKSSLATGLLCSALIFTGSMSAFAHDGEFGSKGHDDHDRMDFPLPGVLDDFTPKEGPCSMLKLDKDQKVKLKEAFFRFEDQKIELESQVKKAHLQSLRVHTNPGATLKEVQDASQALVASIANKMQAEMNYHDEVAFGILQPSQRGPARACEMMRMHHHKADKEHGPKKPDGQRQ
jgi:hypothetical protein